LEDDFAHLLHLRLEAADFEQDNGLRGFVHLIDGIVHRCYEVLDIGPIERRDEATPDCYQNFAGDLVGFSFTLENLLAVIFNCVATAQ
jgi:hypothetical protein